jgi:SAM-dependent methyltransferase
LHILELGCGTGEDAFYLARKGHHVLGTDISGEMIEVAKKKAGKEKLAGTLSFEVQDMRKLYAADLKTSFDLIFSNFGAMNFLSADEFDRLFKFTGEVLGKEGKIIGVIMPQFCAWESLYFTIKGRWHSIFRRKTKEGVMANIGGKEIRTWYYSRRQINKLSGHIFEIARIRPVGFFLPPSYLDPFFSRKRWLLNLLAALEERVSGFSFLSGLSDHYIFELRRKV